MTSTAQLKSQPDAATHKPVEIWCHAPAANAVFVAGTNKWDPKTIPMSRIGQN